MAIDEAGKLFVLAPEDMVLHSAVHLFQEGEFGHGLRDLLDINDMLLHFGKVTGFWQRLFTRAEQLGLNEPLYHALHHACRLFNMRIPAEFAEQYRRVRPNALNRAIMAILFSDALKPHHPSCNSRFSALARWLLYVRSHYLRMPWFLVIPHLVRKAYMRRFGT